MEAAQTSICNLVTTVEHILQASEDVSSRLARIETMFAAPTGYSASALRAPIDNDDEIAQPQVSTEEPLNSDLSRKILQFDPNLESELHASRVYMRTKHRHSMSSLNSTYDSVAGLSFLSGISLAQISSISVISLPIFSYELWNPQQYRDIRSTDMSTSLRAQYPIDSTARSRYDTSNTRIGGLAPEVTAGLFGFLDVDGVQVKNKQAVISCGTIEFLWYQDQRTDGVADGGGVRGLGSLLILRDLMNNIGDLEKSLGGPEAESSFAPRVYRPMPNQTSHTDADINTLPSPSDNDVPIEPEDIIPTPTHEVPNSSLFLPCHYFDYAAGTSTGG